MILAVANQKGGVGKTTSAVNLGFALAEEGAKVLIVDVDPQSNATSALNQGKRHPTHLYDVLVKGVSIEKAIYATSQPNLYLIPAHPDLAAADVDLVEMENRETRLRGPLRSVADRFEFIILDCPPSLGLLTLNALTAADRLLVPIQCEYYALEGVHRLLDTVGRVKKALNPALGVGWVLLTMKDSRTVLSAQVSANVRQIFGDQVFSMEIPRNVPLSEAPSFGKSVFEYDRSCKGAEAYRQVAREMREKARGLAGASAGAR